MRRLRQTNGRGSFRGFDVSRRPRPTTRGQEQQQPGGTRNRALTGLPGRVTIRPLGMGCSGPKAKACPWPFGNHQHRGGPKVELGTSNGNSKGSQTGSLLLVGLQVDRQEASCCLGWCADSWALWDLWAPHHRDFQNGLGWCGNNQGLAEGVCLRPTRTEARQVQSPVSGTCVQSFNGPHPWPQHRPLEEWTNRSLGSWGIVPWFR